MLIKKAFIPVDVKSLNEFLFSTTVAVASAAKKRKFSCNFKYMNYSKKWEKELAIFFPKKEEREKKYYVLKILRLYNTKKVGKKKGSRNFDFMNLMGGLKPVPDYLKRSNWLYEDSPAWFFMVPFQRKIEEGEEPGTILELYDNKKDVLALLFDKMFNELGLETEAKKYLKNND